MIPWIQVYSNLPTHPKVGRLVDALDLRSSVVEPEAVAVGILICLWSWACQNAHDGNLSKCSARAIARAARWKKNPDDLVSALKDCGFIDEDMQLHNWELYAELYINREDYRREQTRKRVAEYRARKRAELGIKTCSYCGKEATGFDHIVPRSKGGGDEDENLTPCCKRCNSSKGSKDLADFLNTTTVDINVPLILDNEKLMRHVELDEFGHFVTLQKVKETTLPYLT